MYPLKTNNFVKLILLKFFPVNWKVVSEINKTTKDNCVR